MARYRYAKCGCGKTNWVERGTDNAACTDCSASLAEQRRARSHGIVIRHWDKLHENDSYFPTGYSMQAGRVVSGRADLENCMREKGCDFTVDGDYRKLRGTRITL